jgi:uncharacterized RDD family membrane protein YckC
MLQRLVRRQAITSPSDQTPAPGQVQCEITRQWVAENEIITLHGKRVCAEGKAILLERLQSGESLPGQMETPGVLRRLGCSFLDNILIGIVAFVSALVFGVAPAAGPGGPPAAMSLVGQVVMWILALGYTILLHGRYGQTLGKRAGSIKVVMLDGQPISYATAAMRAIVPSAPFIVSGVLLSFGAFAIGNALNFGGWLFALANAASALMDRDTQRALHDRICGTRVIQID